MKNHSLLIITLLIGLSNNLASQTNNALNFDGLDDYVNLGIFPATSNFNNGFSFTSWVKWNTFNYWSRLLELSNGPSNNNIVIANSEESNYLNFTIYSGSANSSFQSDDTIVTNSWVHIAVTIDNSGFACIYLNGVLSSSAQLNIPVNVERTNCFIGRSTWNNDKYFKGTIDEVSIWNRALTNSEIIDLMNDGISNTQGLVRFYGFNQGTAMGDNTSVQTLLCDIPPQGATGNLINFSLNGSTSNWVTGYDTTLYYIPEQRIDKDTIDPFLGNHVFKNSAELLFQVSTPSGKQSRSIYDFSNNTMIRKIRHNYEDEYKIPNNGNTDVITGDFDGDYADEIISAWECSNHSIAISVPEINKDSLTWTNQKFTILNSVLFYNKNNVDLAVVNNQIRLVAGDFDADPSKEFLLSYKGSDDKVHIVLYNTDNLLNLEKTTETTIDASNPYFRYDIAAGDFDGDGLDELVFMNLDYLSLKSKYFKLVATVFVYDYDLINKAFDIKLKKSISCKDFNRICGWEQITGIALATGEFNGDGREEVICNYENTDVLYPNCYPNLIPPHPDETTKSYRLSYFIIEKSLTDIKVYNNTNEYIIGILTNSQTCSNWCVQKYPCVVSVAAGDLNNDGIDEIASYSGTNISVLGVDKKNQFYKIDSFPIGTKYNFQSHNIIAVADIDNDISNRGRWFPEIIFIDFVSDMARIGVYRPIINNLDSITGIEGPVDFISLNLSVNGITSCALALGDFDGDGLRLGEPTKRVSDVFVPVMIMNAPPTHFDIINNSTLDINKLYHNSLHLDPYTQIMDFSSANSFVTKLKYDWNLSASIKSELNSYFSKNIVSNYKGTYSLVKPAVDISVLNNEKAVKEDKYYGLNTRFYLFEYPVFSKRKEIGSFLFVLPTMASPTWSSYKTMDMNTISPGHQYDNLLSYPSSINFNEENNIYTSGEQPIGISPINVHTITSSDIFNSIIINSNNISYSLDGSSHTAMPWSGGFKHEFDTSFISSHEFKVSSNFLVNIQYAHIGEDYEGEGYSLSPYHYWSKTGVLMFDYEVNIPDEGLWHDVYGLKRDPAFILPYRFDPEKGKTLKHESLRTYTSDIRYFPFDAVPGDTITILATVRNFCLNHNAENIKVHFYLGDPDNGGELISSVDNGKSELTYEQITPRNFETHSFRWKTPDNIPDNPWIFAVVEPDIEGEIRTDNNKGWIPLFGSEKFPAFFPTTIEENKTTDDIEISNFPNPAHMETTIRVKLKENRIGTLNIYNSLGQKIEKRNIIKEGIGFQYISINVSAYKPGVYYFQLTDGINSATTKMMVE
jgi:hypothetical protein